MATTRPGGRARHPQKGQAIVLVALLILVLFAMLGLAIDSGRAYVDRRDQQTAVDAAALAAGDWYENFHDLYGSTLPKSKQIYQDDLHLYGGSTSDVTTTTKVGPKARSAAGHRRGHLRQWLHADHRRHRHPVQRV